MSTRCAFIFMAIFIFTNCSNRRSSNDLNQNQQSMLVAKQIKINELKVGLTQLQNSKTEFPFIGITSNGVDCIYFVYENGRFNLEFEAMSEKQIPFIDKLKEFANSNNFKNSMTTYNNKPNYKSDNPAPVLKIETNATIEEIISLGTKIQSEIFLNDGKTIYDVVP